MDSSSIGMIVALVLLLCASAYFSATETAFSSLNKIRLRNKAEDGNRRAAATLALAEDFDRLLSTILVGNNIVNIRRPRWARCSSPAFPRITAPPSPPSC